MSTLHPTPSLASVRSILTLLTSRDARLVAGTAGLEHRVTWSCRMRARLPAFESIQGGELALLTLSQLRRLDETLPHLLSSLHKEGVAAVGVAAQAIESLGDESIALSDQLHLPLIWLPSSAMLEEIEREIITFVVGFRGEVERKATEIAHHLMQLSVQGAGIKGVCEYLATSRNKWVVVQDAEEQVRLQATPDEAEPLQLPSPLNDESLRQQGLIRVIEPVLIRHEAVGYLSLLGHEKDFDFLERIVLGRVAPILALEFARQRERSEVENKYQVEALTDVLHGHYQQPEEMLTRTRILGYDLSVPQVVVVFEATADDTDYASPHRAVQWSRRVRDELQRAWPSCWLLSEARRVVALLPLTTAEGSDENEQEYENSVFSRLERLHTRMQQSRSNSAGLSFSSCGIGRIAKNLSAIPQSFREAQQALEIGRRLFGESKIHAFARLGVYRLLFYLAGQSEMNSFYQETLGPLLQQDARNDGSLVETLEGFFRCNANLSETARAMHLHRNSLLYRLGRIEEILGRSLEDPELRLSLQISLKIHHLQDKTHKLS